MFWLGSPPWGRWATAAAIVLLAVWFEVRPASTVEHPFATVDILPGEVIGPDNTAMRPVPAGMLPPIDLGATASRLVAAGQPVFGADTTGASGVIPTGWWTVTAKLPSSARVGDRVLVVVLDRGEAFQGFVAAAPGDDPFAGSEGAVAVAPEHAAVVAVAAADGRMAVMVSTG